MANAAKTIVHPIEPTYDKNSRVLILGSFPSVKSREMMYFYGHPQNRFWKVVASLYKEDVPMTVEERHAFLIRSRIAAWDCFNERKETDSLKYNSNFSLSTWLVFMKNRLDVSKILLAKGGTLWI